MNIRHRSRWYWLSLFAVAVLLFFARSGATQKAPSKDSSTVETANGLTVVTFALDPGTIIVNLPDDMRAGDTISGTVVAEPKGQTPEERARNMTVLSGYVVEVQPPKNRDGTSNPKVTITAQVTAAPGPFTFTLPPSSQPNFQRYELTASIKTDLGRLVFGTDIPVDEISERSLSSLRPHSVENHIYQLPTIGQQGQPIVITGPFDGNSSNTMFKWCINLTPACGRNPSTGGVIAPLAESPRKLVFAAPINVTGPIEVQLKEGNTETKGTYRNVGVNLTAPKTSLMKGESTELHVEVNGLQGITQPIPLHLTKGGVVTMQGGGVQTIRIPPSDVNANGTYTTTRTITGVQAGVWNATATVVVFDVCLQDDKTGNRLQFNSTSGDYIFCVFPTVVAGDPGRVNIPWYGITTPDTGSVGWSGCTITLQHNSTDGRVTAQLDKCTQAGSATVQPASSKITFTITDRDTRNNTCACK